MNTKTDNETTRLRRTSGKQPHRPAARTATLLLAEADRSARQRLADLLTHAGFSLLLAEAENDALELLQANHVDMVLLDGRLRQQCEWSTLAHVARRNPLIPIIIMTADPDQQSRAAEQGADASLQKPIEGEVLLRTISELLAQPWESRLRRVCAIERFSHYAPRTYMSFVRTLQARYAAPLVMPELERVLASLPVLPMRKQ